MVCCLICWILIVGSLVLCIGDGVGVAFGDDVCVCVALDYGFGDGVIF